MDVAKIKLKPVIFEVIEPIILLESIKLCQSEQEYQNILSQYYIECSETGNKIPLNKLRYWDVETQKVYSSPDVIPSNKEALEKYKNKS